MSLQNDVNARLLTHLLLAEKAREQLGNRHAHIEKVVSLDREGERTDAEAKDEEKREIKQRLRRR